jgi:hypothetical protein
VKVTREIHEGVTGDQMVIYRFRGLYARFYYGGERDSGAQCWSVGAGFRGFGFYVHWHAWPFVLRSWRAGSGAVPAG